MEEPVYYWDPVIAPSGMTFYQGSLFDGWQGNLLIAALNPGAVVRLVLAPTPPPARSGWSARSAC